MPSLLLYYKVYHQILQIYLLGTTMNRQTSYLIETSSFLFSCTYFDWLSEVTHLYHFFISFTSSHTIHIPHCFTLSLPLLPLCDIFFLFISFFYQVSFSFFVLCDCNINLSRVWWRAVVRNIRYFTLHDRPTHFFFIVLLVNFYS